MTRLNKNSYNSATLTAVERPLASNEYEDLIRNYLENTPTSTSTPADLTNTDLIGRQLLTDYLNLNSAGQATDANINILADRYIESIPTLISTDKLTYTNLQSVPNNKANFIKYANDLALIQTEYAQKASGVSTKVVGASSFGPTYYAYTNSMSEIYAEIALKLQQTPAPIALVQKHLELTNNCLSSVAAMSAIAKTERDPASSFAGIILVSENIDVEQQILEAIEQVLKQNGV